jgi:acyl-CoA synthetase (AMP-forming)/AMP-acid ligase II
MPNTEPVVGDATVLRSLREAARREARIPVGFLASVTRGLEGGALTEMAELADAGALGFSDDGRPVHRAAILRLALQYQRLCGGVLALHEEDPSLSGAGVMHEGEVSARLGLAGIPSISESTMIARDSAIAGYEEGRIHIQHLSARESVAAVAEAKARGVERSRDERRGEAGDELARQTRGRGELLVRGDVVMTGYRNQPDKTAEALDSDGWLHTGDIAEFDEEGYVKIVDRKKEIIINAAGKNMSPANIESALKGAGPIIGQIAVIGDARAYNTALVVLDSDFAPAFAAQQGLEGRSLEDLAEEEAVRAAVQAAVDKGNAELARVEQVKKFTILRGDWAPGGDELTPTMKLKRKPIAEKYAGEIEAMYS